MLLLSFFLPATDDEGSPEGLEAHVQARYETLHPEGDEQLRDLSGFDEELLADVGVMVNLLNASGIGIHQELVHALCYEYGHDVETHDEIEGILHELEGWFLFPDATEGGPTWTTHEIWSTLYLRELAQEHAEEQESSRRRDRSEERTARCLDSLFRLFDDEEHLGDLSKEFPGSRLFEQIESEPQEETDEYLEEIFEMGEDWPVLAPLFGTTETAGYSLPETASMTEWMVTQRGHAHLGRGAYDKASTEYEHLLDQSQNSDDLEEAKSLNNLGNVARARGEYEEAEEYLQESLEIKREIGDRQGEATSLNNLGIVARVQGEYDEAREYYQESLEIAREIGDRRGEATSLNNLGWVARVRGEYDEAREYYESARDIFQRLGAIRRELTARRNLIELEIEKDETQRARERYEAAIERLNEIDRELPEERKKLEDLRDSITDE